MTAPGDRSSQLLASDFVSGGDEKVRLVVRRVLV